MTGTNMDATSIQQYFYQVVQQVTEYLQNLLVSLRQHRSRASRNLQKLWRNASYRASSRTPTTSSGAPRTGNGAPSQHSTVKPTRSDKSKFERVFFLVLFVIISGHARCFLRSIYVFCYCFFMATLLVVITFHYLDVISSIN